MLVCAEPAEPADTNLPAGRLVDKLLKLRLFADNAGRMNRSVVDAVGPVGPVGAADVAGALPRDYVKRCRGGRFQPQSAY